jgi:Icc-related predicted phosphoesterase
MLPPISTHRRKTRIVCVSDTHNQTPSLPRGDVLIHAGDLTNQGSLSELKKTVTWLEKADFEAKIVVAGSLSRNTPRPLWKQIELIQMVAGNHDITLDNRFYSEHWAYFHNQQRQDEAECLTLLKNSISITYLEHSSAHIKLESPKGPHSHFKIFGSPYSPAHGLWAFGYKPEEAANFWDDIPSDSDIVITHTPPKGHCDPSVTKTRAGCESLRRALWRVRPILAVCGHMHEGRGVERVKWQLGIPNAEFLEESVCTWVDPGAGDGNKKQSIVDLTEASSNTAPNDLHLSSPRRGNERFISSASGATTPSAGKEVASLVDKDSYRKSRQAHLHHSKGKAAVHGLAGRSTGQGSDCKDSSTRLDTTHDLEAGEVNRTETCIVDAAIMANSWGGPKRFNKPVVVDVELPVWYEYDEYEE